MNTYACYCRVKHIIANARTAIHTTCWCCSSECKSRSIYTIASQVREVSCNGRNDRHGNRCCSSTIVGVANGHHIGLGRSGADIDHCGGGSVAPFITYSATRLQVGTLAEADTDVVTGISNRCRIHIHRHICRCLATIHIRDHNTIGSGGNRTYIDGSSGFLRVPHIVFSTCGCEVCALTFTNGHVHSCICHRKGKYLNGGTVHCTAIRIGIKVGIVNGMHSNTGYSRVKHIVAYACTTVHTAGRGGSGQGKCCCIKANPVQIGEVDGRQTEHIDVERGGIGTTISIRVGIGNAVDSGTGHLRVEFESGDSGTTVNATGRITVTKHIKIISGIGHTEIRPICNVYARKRIHHYCEDVVHYAIVCIHCGNGVHNGGVHWRTNGDERITRTRAPIEGRGSTYTQGCTFTHT